MKMPNNEEASVAEKKITEYLLSETHQTGKHKATFFKGFGFNCNEITAFEIALKIHAIEREIENIKESEFGKKYELKCDINTPDKRNPCIVSIWIIENESKEPKLITAYPAK